MRTLIVVIHPNIESSVVNKKWIEEIKSHPDKYQLHELHKVYSEEKIDVQAEQKLIEQYDKIVFQFPFYWFNCPPLFKKWLDEVLTYGWAYGSKSGYKIKGKKITLAVSVGIDEHEYNSNKKYKYTLSELLRPFELTFEYVKADYRPFFAYYGIELDSTEEWIESSISSYLDFLKKF
ncbi:MULTISPECIES: NAD(P)H-dependent oxidoreductase [Sphingobacterium]|uniref:NAD(P)H-dependent oxidoreductase n=1 Tax=Sphingobacterium TaxID=28453 RepID=UPI0013D91EED|nr:MULTISPECIES: NAD(P)H-dependent oxidoreductase [unclassified Sphingobacterium]